ncbi:membrane protein [Bacillus anthracis]|nr:membrane protein [Bacillus anthracis]KOS23868.1 membrane protein [Bacillus anthracis]
MIGDLKGEALDSLEGKWGLAVGATLLISILISAFSFSVDFIFSQFWDWKEVKNSLSVDVITILVIGPLTLGGYYLALHIIREKDARIGNIFRWFTGGSKFIKSFLLYIVVNIFLFLWCFLFIVPGIIKSFSYSMSYFILVEHPDYSVSEAIRESRRMMDGHKLEFFVFCLCFIGWFLLSCITLGIGFLWLIPYFYTTSAAFYEEIAEEYYEKEIPAL